MCWYQLKHRHLLLLPNSRRAKMEARVFFQLHVCTRGFHYPDDELISKNFPHFFQDLLWKVDSMEDVSRALTKFFRYNLINDFGFKK